MQDPRLMTAHLPAERQSERLRDKYYRVASQRWPLPFKSSPIPSLVVGRPLSTLDGSPCHQEKPEAKQIERRLFLRVSSLERARYGTPEGLGASNDQLLPWSSSGGLG